MNVYIQPGPGTTRVDVTPYLEDKEGGLSALTQSREYRRFKRESSDARVVLSNHDGVIEALLANITTDRQYILTIEEGGERLFHGVIPAERVTHNAHGEWFNVSAYDPMAQLTSLMRRTRARPDYPLGKPYPPVLVTLQGFLELELMQRHRLHETGLFTSIDCGDFASTGIRYASNSPVLGNYGRFTDIDPGLTWDKLLEGIGIWWNADFWIDPVTLVLKMTHRRSKTGTTRDVSSKVYDDTVTISLLDEDPVDWISVILPYVPKEPQLVVLTPVEFTGGTYLQNLANRLSYSFNNDLVIYVVVYFQEDIPLYTSHGVVVQIPDVAAEKGFQPRLLIPAGGSSCTRRGIFRWVQSIIPQRDAFWGPLFVTELSNNEAKYIEDNIGPQAQLHMQGLVPLPEGIQAAPQTAFCRINHTTGQWVGPIYAGDFEERDVNGNILDCYPELRFTLPSSAIQVQEFGAHHVSYFFGNGRTFQEVREHYADLFQKRLGVKLTVRGTRFMVGDEVIIDNVPRLYGRRNVIVKSAKTHLQSEKTELECYL